MCILKITTIAIIVVIILLVCFILHSISIRNTNGNGGRVVVHGTYNVTVEPKTEDNKFYGQGSDNAFYINGIEAPLLYLERNAYYEFVNETDEPLYFTTDPDGGSGAPGSLAKKMKNGFIGHSKGTIFFKITEDLPSTFYYQSGANKNMGSVIIVI